MKKCTKCGIEKNLSEFPTRLGKHEARCKVCARENSRKHHHANREKRNLQRKKLYEENRQRFTDNQKKYYQKNKDKIRARVRERDKLPENREKNRKRTLSWAKKNSEKWYQYSKEYKDRNPEKVLAHQYVMWALRLGVLKKPNNCEKCGLNIKLEAHHKDYSKQLDVMWLCRICHAHEHGKLLDKDSRIQYGNSSTGQYIECDKIES